MYRQNIAIFRFNTLTGRLVIPGSWKKCGVYKINRHSCKEEAGVTSQLYPTASLRVLDENSPLGVIESRLIDSSCRSLFPS